MPTIQELVMISNQAKFTKLQPEDVEFYEQVNSRITGSNALPYEIPADAFFRTVVAAMKWFWHWYEPATQETLLYIPYSEIQSKGVKYGGNIDLLLPNGIEGIFDWKQASQSSLGSVNDYLRISLLQTFTATGAGAGNGYGYGGNNTQMSNIVISMFEANQYRETFTRGIRANFNKNTGKFRIMSSIDTGLVLSCFVRLQPFELYGDIMFEDYVVACVEAQLGRIMTSFDFNYPGGIKLNYDPVQESGKTRKQEIEEEIKGSNNNDFMMTK